MAGGLDLDESTLGRAAQAACLLLCTCGCGAVCVCVCSVCCEHRPQRRAKPMNKAASKHVQRRLRRGVSVCCAHKHNARATRESRDRIGMWRMREACEIRKPKGCSKTRKSAHTSDTHATIARECHKARHFSQSHVSAGRSSSPYSDREPRPGSSSASSPVSTHSRSQYVRPRARGSPVCPPLNNAVTK